MRLNTCTNTQLINEKKKRMTVRKRSVTKGLNRKKTKGLRKRRKVGQKKTKQLLRCKSRRSVIRKPKSPWIIFCNEHRAELIKNDPTLSFGDICKIAGVKWRSMTGEEKQNYVTQSKADRKRYEEQLKNLTPEQRRIVRAWRKKRKDQKKLRPKPALSPYMFFVCETRNKVAEAHKTAQFPDIGRMLGQMWNSMTDSEKQPFFDKSKQDRVRYSGEMELYTQKLLEQKEAKRLLREKQKAQASSETCS